MKSPNPISVSLSALYLGTLFLASPVSSAKADDFAARQARASAAAARLLPQLTQEEKLLQLLAYRPDGVARLGIPKSGTGGGYGGYRYVRDDYESAIASLNAGVDMELVGNLYMKDILRAVKEGKVSDATVNRAAERVLHAKILLLGLGEPKASPEPAAKNTNSTMEVIGSYQDKDDIWAKLIAEGRFSTPESGRQPNWREIVNAPADDALALRAAQKAIVPLKNDRQTLPQATRMSSLRSSVIPAINSAEIWIATRWIFPADIRLEGQVEAKR